MKKIILRYSITFGVGLIIALVIMLSKSIFSQDNAKNVHHILTDAFFVPGVVICGYGLLVMASNGGTFDMLVYSTLCVKLLESEKDTSTGIVRPSPVTTAPVAAKVVSSASL